MDGDVEINLPFPGKKNYRVGHNTNSSDRRIYQEDFFFLLQQPQIKAARIYCGASLQRNIYIVIIESGCVQSEGNGRSCGLSRRSVGNI